MSKFLGLKLATEATVADEIADKLIANHFRLPIKAAQELPTNFPVYSAVTVAKIWHQILCSWWQTPPICSSYNKCHGYFANTI